jgi:hypothetical protein
LPGVGLCSQPQRRSAASAGQAASIGISRRLSQAARIGHSRIDFVILARLRRRGDKATHRP